MVIKWCAHSKWASDFPGLCPMIPFIMHALSGAGAIPFIMHDALSGAAVVTRHAVHACPVGMCEAALTSHNGLRQHIMD